MPELSIILPVLNEAQRIASTLQMLAPFRHRGAEIIVVDGGSEDHTPDIAYDYADRVLIAPPGRAKQMNAGASVARGYVLLFLHADTWLPPDADTLILYGPGRETSVWGRFDVEIEGQHRLLPLVARMMNARSRATGIATGDQAMFMTREAFIQVRGFPDIALMEDIAISKKLKEISPPLCLAAKVITSGRRWDEYGLWTTIWRMWRLRLAYRLGADPAELARRYGYKSREDLAEPQRHEPEQDQGGSDEPGRPDWLFEKHNRNRRAE
jgi:rSAM/selenodomain-associated transferase 2